MGSAAVADAHSPTTEQRLGISGSRHSQIHGHTCLQIYDQTPATPGQLGL
jgi:hypothetical protein